MENAIDLLIQKIRQKDNPTVIGLDPTYEKLPQVLKKNGNVTLDEVCSAIYSFNTKIIDAICDIIPAVKINIAFYEQYGARGIETFAKTCTYAKQKDMVVIADIKRGDIGSTATAYSTAYIGKTKIGDIEKNIFDIDWVTVNPYLGIDGVKPFLEDCKKYQKGIFILVKTSNPSSGELQDLKTEDGNNIYTKVAKLVEKWSEELGGDYGYSSVGAVVGATYPKQLEELREKMPHAYFLIPGYGAQGGKAEDIALGFDRNGLGGIVNASRSLMYAYQNDRWSKSFTEDEFEKATRAEAIRMRDELNKALKK